MSADKTEIKYHLADLEYVLSVHLRPTMLIIIAPEELPGEIHIIVSCLQFKGKTIESRIGMIFQLLSKYCPGIIGEYLIVARALDGQEVIDYLDDVFEE